MKNTITINIGLVTSERTGKRALLESYVFATLFAHGFGSLVTRCAVHTSNTEPTFVVELVTADALADVLSALAVLSDALEQDCIAVHVVNELGEASGHLVGDKAEAWGPFNPSLFLTLDGRTLAEVEAAKRATSATPPAGWALWLTAAQRRQAWGRIRRERAALARAGA